LQNQNTTTTSDRSLLTDKELHYVKDFLSWELLAMKKCNEAANSCQDAQIKQLIQETGRKHQQHYDAILSHLR
jgi:hypothetical protein